MVLRLHKRSSQNWGWEAGLTPNLPWPGWEEEWALRPGQKSPGKKCVRDRMGGGVVITAPFDSDENYQTFLVRKSTFLEA